MGRKPDDFWALPLKRAHHINQHAFGSELLWWKSRGVSDPWQLCLRYHVGYVGDSMGYNFVPELVHKAVRRRSSRPIQSRPFAKIHRPLRHKGPTK